VRFDVPTRTGHLWRAVAHPLCTDRQRSAPDSTTTICELLVSKTQPSADSLPRNGRTRTMSRVSIPHIADLSQMPSPRSQLTIPVTIEI
jgi:hypothetical protein